METKRVDGMDVEVVTAREALTRVGLGDLASSLAVGDYRVLWRGYPRPFACGHTATYGFGPLARPEQNDRYGAGRSYQETVRVSQAICGGPVLFSWSSEERHRSLVVSIEETPDDHATCLRVGWTG